VINYLKLIKIDKQLLISLILISGFGLFVLYSASDSLNTIIRQGVHFVLAFVVMIAISQIPPRFIKMVAVYLVIIGIILLILVYFFGSVRGGARRWLDFGFMMFQPSELMKVIVPVAVTSILSASSLPPKLLTIFYSLLVIIIAAGLIVIQPDLGTAIIIASSGFFALFFSGFSIKILKNTYLNITLIISALVGFLSSAWFFLLAEYQKQRILTLFNPESDPLGRGYHTIQAKIAIGSGGLFGKGYGAGTQSQLDFLPEHATDFIFATIAEELGFIGVLVLLFLYFLIIYRCLRIAIKADEVFNKLLAASLTMVFFSYVFINVGMVSGLLPIVGVPLPLISYGGSSILTLMLAFGLIMAISNYKKPSYLT
jgi:rod shape determining protein RodA